MKHRTRILLARAFLLLLVAFFITALPFNPDSATYAQSGTTNPLPAPQLSATPTGTNAIELRWNAIAGVVRYELRVWWAGLSGWQRIDDGSLTGQSFTHGDRTTGRTYFYIVAGIDSNGDRGAWSEQVSVVLPASATPTPTPTPTSQSLLTPTPTSTPTSTPAASAPPPPTLQAQAGPGQVTLTWNVVANAASYQIIVFDWDLYVWQFIGGSHAGTTYTHLGLAPGTTYHFQIRSVAADGTTGAWSQSATAAVTESSPPPEAAAQKAVLVTLYQETDGANWRRNNNWLTALPLSDWDGVTTDSNGNVTGLNLPSNSMKGQLPDLSALTRLTDLNLAVNQLNGQIPDLSALTNLTNLNLVINQLNGQIPDLSALVNLTSLDLGSNQLSGSIPVLSALTNLRQMRLCCNQLNGQVPELSTLTNLRQLHLYGNQLSGQIPELSALTELEELHLGDNQLSGQIPSLNALVNLRELHLWGNHLTGPIPDLGALTKLTRLFLSDNQLSGQIPDLSALTNLTQLYLDDNRLTGPIPDLSALTKLDGLGLSDNQLCLPAGASLSHPSVSVTLSLQSLNLPTCPVTATRTPTPTPTSGPTPTPTASTLAAPVLRAAASAGQITLTWDAVANADSYVLIVWDWAVNDWRPIGGVLRGNSYVHSGLTAGTTYYFHIQAVAASGAMSAWSQQLSATVPATSSGTPTPTPTPTPTQTSTGGATATPTPTAPALSAPVLNANPGPGQITLSWGAIASAVSYRLLVWDNTLNRWLDIGGALTGSSYIHRGLTVGTKYYFLIQAVGAGNETSPWSAHAIATVTEPAAMPDASTQRAALTALYNATDGPNWRFNDNWLTNEPVSTWFGVFVDDRGRIVRLSLDNNFLSGSLPNLNGLTDLKVLSLVYNDLTGPLPDPSGLTNLLSLDLHHNRLTGPLPDLSSLTNLVALSLHNNQISGPIPDLSKLTNLTSLQLYDNQFSGPIPDLRALTNLEYLDLNSNLLSGQIPDLSALTSLISLSLQDNHLTGPIPDFRALNSLNFVDLSGNDLCLPDGSDLSALNAYLVPSLEKLNLPSCTPAGPEQRAALVALYNATDGANWRRNDNWLTNEPIGTWFGVFTNSYGQVTRLSLGHNQLNGTLTDLSTLTSLARVFLAGNQLSGSIFELSALTRLEDFVLESNQLSGPIPDLSANTRLLRLSFAHNKLTGPVPDLSALTRLGSLSIGGNELTGAYPDLGALTNLETVSLTPNRLTGPLSDLSALTNLRELYLHSGQLSGPFPDLSASKYLATLFLGDNEFTGEIPALSGFPNLVTLNLSDNQFSGNIPDLGALTKLQWLYLDNNQLTGAIPNLSALTNLRDLNFSHNQLTGEIPDLGNLNGLTRLDLSNNQLTGPFPDLSLLANLSHLFLNDNGLTGPILNLQQLTNLTFLYLGNNDLSGPLPDLSSLTGLTSLNLTGNRLCLPAGASLSHPQSAVASHLNSLNLSTCTSAETMLAPALPQNLTAIVSGSQVTLAWDAVANAASYELRVWNSLDRQWGPLGGALNSNSYTHTVQTDGRSYYYQVRARNASSVRGPWSDRVHAVVVTPRFPPPPLSLGLDIFYQKYLDVGGVAVVAPTEVSDEKMVQARAVISGMFSTRPDLLAAIAADSGRVAIYKYSEESGGISQLPELSFLSDAALGYVHKTPALYVAGMPAEDAHCGTFIHEIAHMAHYEIDDLPGGAEFDARVHVLYQAAQSAGRWQNLYASTNHREYWAEMVRFWFWESLPPSLGGTHSTLDEYDPEAAKLVEEVFAGATVPAECKP